jgi:hypothetical protein
LAGRDGEMIRLASGRQVYAQSVIAPIGAGIPQALSYWDGPGRGLWPAVAARLPEDIWAEVRRHPGRCLTVDRVTPLVQAISATPHTKIIGRNVDLAANAPFVDFDPAVVPFYSWDVVREIAYPARGITGHRYWMLRAVTDIEAARSPPETAGSKAPSKRLARRGCQGVNNPS